MTRKAWRQLALRAQMLVQSGRKVEAIKVLRDGTACGLKEAYDAATQLHRLPPVRLVAIGLVAVAIATVSCTVPTAPSQGTQAIAQAQAPGSSQATITVQVLDRADQATGLHAAVYVDHRYRGSTGAGGVLRVAVTAGGPCSIDVQAEGYRPMGADAEAVGEGETWTFYLERLQ